MTVKILSIRESFVTTTTIFKSYLNVTEWLASPGGTTFSKPIQEMSKEELNVRLKCFYTSARKKDGTHYKSSSTKSIRAAIDRRHTTNRFQ